jgi:hypothetical protein
MRTRALLIERSRIAADLAKVEKGIRDLPSLVANRQITLDRAECVLAIGVDEIKRLNQRLADIDKSLAARSLAI